LAFDRRFVKQGFGHMVWVFALLCSTSLAAADCDGGKAIDVIRLPDEINEMACLHNSMAVVASLGIQAGTDEYWKFVCVRPNSKQSAALVGRSEDEERHDE
jgi:hypothetical protein